MEKLSPLDSAFLEIEDEDPHTSLAIASVSVIAGPAPKYDDFVDAITSRLTLIPRYRQKVRRIPLDLGPPVWVDADDFSPAQHFRRIALPSPGDRDALFDTVSMIMSERLDRTRPLWECWLLEGLSDGRWALVCKVHHCLADGVSANALHTVLVTAGAGLPSRAATTSTFRLRSRAHRNCSRVYCGTWLSTPSTRSASSPAACSHLAGSPVASPTPRVA